jgi:cephalosporin-C deacetylase-like acetyl esterase
MKRAIEFNSCGETIRGVLHIPDAARGKPPLVVMAGGWCYVKEIVMPYYADDFVDIGCACLVFDYRRFGDSDGEPRQHINPWDQIEDYRNAVSFARTLTEIDTGRIGVWGISYSGGHALCVAALDSRVKFALSVVPVVDGFTTMRRVHGERRFGALNKLILADREKRQRGEPSGIVPMSTAEPDKDFCTWPFPHVATIFNDIKDREAPNHRHENTIESIELLMQYDVMPYARRLYETPYMMAIAKGDNITSADLEIDVFNTVPCPNKHLALVEGVDHMSIYADNEHLAKVSGAQAAWLHALCCSPRRPCLHRRRSNLAEPPAPGGICNCGRCRRQRPFPAHRPRRTAAHAQSAFQRVLGGAGFVHQSRPDMLADFREARFAERGA